MKRGTEDNMKVVELAALVVVLATLAACGGHHGEILHQDRPGGTDYNAAHK
jgi:hypothetical protein